MARMCHRFKKNSGMVLGEVIVALFFVSITIALVAGLGQMVSSFTKSTRQASAVIEIRNRVNSLTRNTDDWMNRLRSSAETASIFTDCLPDSLVASSTYSCPSGDPSLLANDERLREIAGPQLQTIVDVPLVDNSGQKIAGDLANPVYMNSDGGFCQSANPETSCALRSTGYFLRSNSSTTSNPGSVRFVIKIDRNLRSSGGQGLTAMKAQYMTVDVGTDWLRSVGECAPGSLKLGYLSNGKPYCVSKMKQCASGEVAIGVQSSGDPECATPSCSGTSKPIFDQQNSSLTCSDSSPCADGTVFMGYYATSGERICSNIANKCGAGTVQVGIDAGTGGSVQPICKAIPTNCTSSQVIVYSGEAGGSFVCANETSGVACASNEVLVGITRTGKSICEARSVISDPGTTTGGGSGPLATMDCGAGNFLQGMQWNETTQQMQPICGTASNNNDDNELKMAGVNTLPGWNPASGESSFEAQARIWPVSCFANGKNAPCGHHYYRFNIDPEAELLTRASYTSTLKNTSRRCMFIKGSWRLLTAISGGGYRYSNVCVGGILYKDFDPSLVSATEIKNPTRLLNEIEVSPPDGPEYSITTSETGADALVGEPIKNASGVVVQPTIKQLLEYLSGYCQNEIENGTVVENSHCGRYKNALETKYNEYRATAFANQRAPNFCRVAVDSRTKAYTCGTGCDLGVILKPTDKTSTGRIRKYRYIFRWARNFQKNEGATIVSGQGRFFSGMICNGSRHTTFPYGAIRYAPYPPNDSESGITISDTD